MTYTKKTPQTWYTIFFLMVLALLSYFFVDLKLAIWLHHHSNYFIQLLAKISSYLGNKLVLVPFFIYFLWLFAYKRHAKHYVMLKTMVTSCIVANIITEVLKITIGRARPYLYFDHGVYGIYGFSFKQSFWSFPSGHVTTACSLFFALSLYIKTPRYLRLLCYLIIILVAISRMLTANHYLADTLAGAVIGIISSYLCYNYNHRG